MLIFQLGLTFFLSSSHWLFTVTTTTARWCCIHYYQLSSCPEHSSEADSLGSTAWSNCSHLCPSIHREPISYSSSQLPITRSIPTRLLARDKQQQLCRDSRIVWQFLGTLIGWRCTHRTKTISCLVSLGNKKVTYYKIYCIMSLVYSISLCSSVLCHYVGSVRHLSLCCVCVMCATQYSFIPAFHSASSSVAVEHGLL